MSSTDPTTNPASQSNSSAATRPKHNNHNNNSNPPPPPPSQPPLPSFPTAGPLPSVTPPFTDQQLAALSALFADQLAVHQPNEPTHLNPPQAPPSRHSTGLPAIPSTASGATVTGRGPHQPSHQPTDRDHSADPNPTDADDTNPDRKETPHNQTSDSESSSDEDAATRSLPSPESFRFDAFTPDWYERRREHRVQPKFLLPPNSSPAYPASFEPEQILHERTFYNKAGTSPGRIEEADSIFVTAAYLTFAVNNQLDILSHFAALAESVEGSLTRRQNRRFREGLTAISDLQLCQFGIYQLLVGRYEILCKKQGSNAGADSTVLESFMRAPLGLTEWGDEAHQIEKRHAIKSAASSSGRNRHYNSNSNRTTSRRGPPPNRSNTHHPSSSSTSGHRPPASGPKPAAAKPR